MHIVMGGTGHVGSAVTEALLRRGEPVAIVTSNASHALSLQEQGVEIIEADVEDVASLRAAFQRGRRAFLLNPPADPTLDAESVERRTVGNILVALEGSGLEKVVAASTGGAQPGERLGDLNVLWELEEGLRQQAIPAAINRAAYYMTNWDGLLDVVRTTGTLPVLFPPDMPIPMVAPYDLGEAAAERLVSTVDDIGVRYIEGPARYTTADVAQAFATVLGRSVELDVTPREGWLAAFRGMGFSDSAAESYTRMTEASVDSAFDVHDDSQRGSTTLLEYISALVATAD